MPKFRTLIVEDSEPMTRLMGGLLRGVRGLSVEFARDGIEALRRLKLARYDLIFTDLEMPLLGGIEFIKKLRQYAEYRTTPVIVVTAENGAAQREAARRAGASAFLGKPLQGARLVELVREIVGAASSTRESPAAASPAVVGFKMAVPAAQAVPAAPARKYKILVCDDDPTLQRLMVSFIASAIGAVVRSVGDGKAAMEMVETFEPDVLVLDMMMPRMNGNQVLEALNERRARNLPAPRVLVYSAIDLRRDVLRKGAHGFLQKPGNIDQIKAAIIDVLNAPAGTRDAAFASGAER